jgi:hypothetical protein
MRRFLPTSQEWVESVGVSELSTYLKPLRNTKCLQNLKDFGPEFLKEYDVALADADLSEWDVSSVTDFT